MTEQSKPTPPPAVGVLIQNRHNLVRGTLRTVVERLYGASVVAEVASPGEIVAAARSTLPDIVVVDLAEGEVALGAVRLVIGDGLTTKVICIADEPSQDLIEEALRAGATGIALKTDSVDDLKRAFEALPEGAATIAPNAAGPLLGHYLEVLEQKRSRDSAVIEALASAIEAKDHYTGGHTRRVAELATRIASLIDPALGSNEQLRFGFILHDIGKIGIPEPILLKKGSLDDEEWEVMKTHPIIGVQIVSPLSLGAETENVIRHHHEAWEGNGYPDILKAEQIPLGARIFSVADTYDAMTTDRPYRSRLAASRAIDEIKDRAGSQFDPDAVEALLEAVGV